MGVLFGGERMFLQPLEVVVVMVSGEAGCYSREDFFNWRSCFSEEKWLSRPLETTVVLVVLVIVEARLVLLHMECLWLW